MDEVVDLPVREIDTSSIQQQMARNKEQLQIKLMVRRPISQLIEQGIIPRKSFLKFKKRTYSDQPVPYFYHLYVYY